MTTILASRSLDDTLGLLREGYPWALRRRDALPKTLSDTLFGKGAVHGLDDEQHRARKAFFCGLLTLEAAAEMARRAKIEREHVRGHSPDPR
jgi:hypothetical protein